MNSDTFWYTDTKLSDLLKTDPAVMAKFNSRKTCKKKGEYIYLPGERSESIFFILSGRIRLGYYKDSDREVVTAILGEGDVFGQNSFISDEKRKDFAMASEDSEISEFRKEELRRLMAENTDLGIYFINFLGSRITELEGKLESLVYQDSRSRVISYLVNAVQKSGQRLGYEWVVRGLHTHQDIASLTATSRQTVTMTLNELRQEQIIDFDRKRLIVRDLSKLKNLIRENT